jgi:hypothetical protein
MAVRVAGKWVLKKIAKRLARRTRLKPKTEKTLKKKAAKQEKKRLKEKATPPFKKKKTEQRRHIKKEKSKVLRKGESLNPSLDRALKLYANAKDKRRVSQTLLRFGREDKTPTIMKEGILSVPKKILDAEKLQAANLAKGADRIDKTVKKAKRIIKRKQKRTRLKSDAKRRRN